MKRAVLFTFVISQLSVIYCAAQQPNIDSLNSIWQDETQTDSARTAAYKDYIWNGFLFNNPDTAFALAEDLVVFAQEKQYPKAQAIGYKIQGMSFYLISNYPKALDYLQRSLKTFEEIGFKPGQASIVYNIGGIYLAQSNFPKGLDYLQRSLKISEEIGYKEGIAHTVTAIGGTYSQEGNYPKALNYLQRGLKMMEEMGIKEGIGSALGNIGGIYLAQSNYPQALNYFQRCSKVFEEILDKRGMAIALGSIGETYNKQGNHHDAIIQCQKALDISEKISSIELQKEMCTCLYDAHKAMGNGDKALAYIEKMNVLNDSLNAEETATKLQQMEFAKQVYADSIAQVEADRLVEEAHQEEVRKKNQTRNIAIGGGLILLILAGALYGRVHYIRKSKAVLQTEKDRSENLLLNILPTEIAAELKEKGRADARDFDLVSILFTDFKGFTEQSAKLSAQDLVAEINTCFEAFDVIMEKYGVEKIKTIGDSYMAAGGLPVPADDSVKNTVLAAIEMQAFIGKRKAEMDAAEKPAFEMRVGIHTGSVVAGIVGVKKFQYDIWGDTVNTASRMESAGEVGKVNISQATYELLKDDVQFSFESRGMIEAKGKGEMEMNFVSLKEEV